MAEAPIWMVCEGSGCPAHSTGMSNMGICSMCGHWVQASGPTNVAVFHKRRDILAMVERGDFDVSGRAPAVPAPTPDEAGFPGEKVAAVPSDGKQEPQR